MKDKSKIIKYTLTGLVIIGLYILSFVFFKNGFFTEKNEQVLYQENNKVDYRVYLKENKFFEEPYLGKDRVYITSLIDFIDIDFNYDMKLNERVSGTYNYYIKGIIRASLSDNPNKDYWSKEYILKEEKKVNYKDLQRVLFNTNVKVDYDYYNDILLDFKKEYNLSADAKLEVVLCVENSINYKDEKADKKSLSLLTIPLTQATIEVPISVDTNKGADVIISRFYEDESFIYSLYKLLSCVLLFIASYMLVRLVLTIVRKMEKKSLYYRQLKKILRDYDSIIVTLHGKLNYDNLTVIDVSKFSELIDAHSEVRQPINFMEDNVGAKFILINDKLAWRYVLKKDI